MKNKKKYIFIITILLLCSIIIYLLNENHGLKESSNNYENNKVTKRENMLSMMLETEANSGNYEMTTRDSWPTDGYVFNTELSKCENGGELSWDDENKRVLMSGNVSDKCYVYFDIKPQVLLADYVKSLYTGTQGANNIYYHTSTLTNGAGDNSYRYAGGDYVLTEAGKATGATMMIGYDENVTTLIEFYCDEMKVYVGYPCKTSRTHYYLIKGDTTQYQTYKETLNKAVEKGYLTKDNVKNFVCFGSAASPCPTENLYRIIGVFGNNVKLIKWDYAKSNLLGTDGDFSQEYSSYYFSGEQGENPTSNSLYYWNNSTQTSTWSESNLNKVNLNTNFITNIGTEWANKIATTTWKVGGNTYPNIVEVPMYTAYQNEIVNPVTTNTTDSKTEYKAKVGLMYVSDYGYAASQSAWTYVGYDRSYESKDYSVATSINWMYMGLKEWTISRNADEEINGAFIVSLNGSVGGDFVNNGYELGVRPSFNLSSSITYVSGSGSADDPIVIN